MAPTTPDGSGSREAATAWDFTHALGLAAILAAIAYSGLIFSDSRVTLWGVNLILIAAFAVLAGHGVTGHWRGILIDSRNRMSMSRLQFVAWTLVILAGILTSAFANLAVSWEAAMDFRIPDELFVLMGISTASLVGSPAILSNKRDRRPAEYARAAGLTALRQQGYQELWETGDSLLVAYKSPLRARWSDLLKGEELGNGSQVDLGKLQMFFFTFILLLVYGAALAAQFAEATGPIESLPEIQDGLNVLLGISHTGYLSSKAISHTSERAAGQDAVPVPPAGAAQPGGQP